MRGDPLVPADWLALAQIDLRRVRATLRDADFGAAAFWLQQSAEKALKGWLIGCGWALVKTHDLERLAGAVTQFGQTLSWFEPTAVRLTKLYFTDR